RVSPRQIQPGDLVFFKTGWKKNHVGIYLRNGKFMHASSSRGVMISEIQNPYWSDAFWMARRY
ncbi:MAG: C40 family peptidase, partial [Gammaproteobacteria bacterium]|nr:C40 family peptidase [Gammaproteobacteria bacterium]